MKALVRTVVEVTVRDAQDAPTDATAVRLVSHRAVTDAQGVRMVVADVTYLARQRVRHRAEATVQDAR